MEKSMIGVSTKLLGVKRSIFAGLGFIMLGFFLFAIANQSWMMYAFMIPYALGGIATPNIQSILSSRVPANEQGELQGGITSLIILTAVIGPVVMSTSFTYFTKNPETLYFPGISFFIGGVLSLISLILSYSVLKRIKLDH